MASGATVAGGAWEPALAPGRADRDDALIGPPPAGTDAHDLAAAVARVCLAAHLAALDEPVDSTAHGRQGQSDFLGQRPE